MKRKFFLSLPVFLVEIRDECILGTDFLKEVGLEKIFVPVFGEAEKGSPEKFLHSPICGLFRCYFFQNFVRSTL